MRVFKPKGVDIFRTTRKRLAYVCTIKSRGRTGARIRARLMAMTPEQREPILVEWALGRAAELPEATSSFPSTPTALARLKRLPRALRRSKRSQLWIEKHAADRHLSAAPD